MNWMLLRLLYKLCSTCSEPFVVPVFVRLSFHILSMVHIFSLILALFPFLTTCDYYRFLDKNRCWWPTTFAVSVTEIMLQALQVRIFSILCSYCTTPTQPNHSCIASISLHPGFRAFTVPRQCSSRKSKCYRKASMPCIDVTFYVEFRSTTGWNIRHGSVEYSI
jgi:hypothetical protein